MMGKAINLLGGLKADRKGVTALEYGVIAAVLVVGVAAAIGSFGNNVSTFLTGVQAKVDTAVSSAGTTGTGG